jgi:hypothetical protein
MAFEVDNIRAAFRTAGALMVGNVFVGIFLLDKSDYLNLAYLFIMGVITIMVFSYPFKKES